MFWTLVLTVTVFLFWYVFVKPLKYWKERGVVQGRPIPVFGDSWKTALRLQNLLDFVQEIYRIGPGERYCGIYQMTYPTLVVKDPELVKQITVKDFDHFTDHNNLTIDPEVDPLFGKNLVFLEGQSWKNMRGLLSPSFTGSKMRYMCTLMINAAETFAEYFKKRSEEIIEVEMKDVFTRYTNDVIATTAFGIQVDSLTNPENRFYLMGREATTFSGFKKSLKFLGFAIMPRIMKFFKITVLSDETNNFFTEVINGTIKEREEKGIVRPDMINLMLESKNNKPIQESTEEQEQKGGTYQEITNIDIVAQALLFFLGGFDTASSFMCFTAYELAVNPGVQNRLREEILQTLEEYNGKLTYEGLMKMKYLDMVASESLRKWPLAPLLDRRCTEPYTIEPARAHEFPVHLQKGDLVLVPVYGIHRDPRYFPNPEKFDPDRFSDENRDQIQPYTYLPFGSGPRNCIGSRFALLEGKAVMCEILANFEIVPTEKTQIPLEIDPAYDLKPKGGFNLGLKRIKT